MANPYLEHPVVLIDIGASDQPPEIWRGLAKGAIYVGFDPDSRERPAETGFGFKCEIMVPKCIVPEKTGEHQKFYFTRSPFCSSALVPDKDALSCYRFGHLFEIQEERDVPVTTVSEVLREQELDRIDWLKTDSQGLDLSIYRSIPEDVRAGILAIDVEPGLIDAYKGEDLFTTTHEALRKEGFWLAGLDVRGSIRGDRSTCDVLRGQGVSVKETSLGAVNRMAPGWCEARYFRTIEWLASRDAGRRDYELLWQFVLADGQFAYALDVCRAIKSRFGADAAQASLIAETVCTIDAAARAKRGNLLMRVKRKLFGI